jgi:hypothetical protein
MHYLDRPWKSFLSFFGEIVFYVFVQKVRKSRENRAKLGKLGKFSGFSKNEYLPNSPEIPPRTPINIPKSPKES